MPLSGATTKTNFPFEVAIVFSSSSRRRGRLESGTANPILAQGQHGCKDKCGPNWTGCYNTSIPMKTAWLHCHVRDRTISQNTNLSFPYSFEVFPLLLYFLGNGKNIMLISRTGILEEAFDIIQLNCPF